MAPGDAFEPIFGSRRGSGRFAIESVSGSASLTEVDRDTSGVVLGARAVGPRGRPLYLRVVRELASAGAECTIDIDGELALPTRLIAGLEHSLERAKCFVGAGDTTIDWVVDASSYEENHLAVISGEAGGAPLAGVLDPRTGASTVQVTLEDWLDSTAVAQLSHFGPVFQEMVIRGTAERAEFDELIRQTIHNSRWGTIGRAACWGLGGLGVAVCSTATAGVGFLAASAAFAAASSVCSDAVSKREQAHEGR